VLDSLPCCTAHERPMEPCLLHHKPRHRSVEHLNLFLQALYSTPQNEDRCQR
jgi:hypothetical protein